MNNEVYTYSVYAHTCPDNKKYIGITRRNPKKRWNKGKGYKSNYNFMLAIEKYGWDNIKHEILFENLTKEQAEQKEIELIKIYDTTNPNNGYNKDKGGNSIGRFTQETRQKISMLRKGYSPSKATREKISKALKGNKLCESTKKKISMANKGRVASPETKIKMSEYAKNRKKSHLLNLSLSLKGKKQSEETKLKHCIPICQFDLNEEFVAKFVSARQATELLGIPYKQIQSCCKGRQKSCRGYIWRYANDTN
jgi:group I intron endonuclease